MKKQLFAFDSDHKVLDTAIIKGTDIILKETGSGKVIFRGSNKVLVSGSEVNAKKSILFDPTFAQTSYDLQFGAIKSYNEAFTAAGRSFTVDVPNGPVATSLKLMGSSDTSNPLNMFGSDGTAYSSATDAMKIVYEYFTKRICLFAVGFDGCGIDNSRVFRVSNTKWIAPYGYTNFDLTDNPSDEAINNCLVPFKVKAASSDLGETDRGIYFGRSITGTSPNEIISYYFKTFDTNPIIHYRWADGSGIIDSTGDIFASDKKSEADVVVELHMTITPSDCREYFKNLDSLSSARINTISLCTGVPYLGKDASGDATFKKFYKDIRPFTKFNFPNESISDTSKGIEVSYYLYF